MSKKKNKRYDLRVKRHVICLEISMCFSLPHFTYFPFLSFSTLKRSGKQRNQLRKQTLPKTKASSSPPKQLSTLKPSKAKQTFNFNPQILSLSEFIGTDSPWTSISLSISFDFLSAFLIFLFILIWFTRSCKIGVGSDETITQSKTLFF